MSDAIARLAARSPAPSVSTRVPWGFPAALGALLISAFTAVVGDYAVFIITSRQYIATHTLAVTAEVFQFFAAGVLLSAVILVQVRYGNAYRRLGFRFPGWRILSTAAMAVIPVFVGV